MKIDLTDLSPVRKRMSVEVDVEDVERETRVVLQSYRKKARIPGFRPGKAPMSVVRSHFTKELEEDVRERVVSSSFLKATREKGLEPIGDPALEDVLHEQGQPLTFNTVFEVLPEIEPKGYDDVSVTQAAVKVEDEEIDKALEELRQARVQLVAEQDREAEKGDVVYADVVGTPEEGESIRSERLPIEIGAENNLDQFNEKLSGTRVGDTVEFSVDYPKDYGSENLAGKRVDYRLQVQEVKRPVLPDLDDEFAKDLGDFEDLAALRGKVREDLEHRKKHEVEAATRQAVLDKVLIENPVVLPEVLVQEEIRRRLESFVRNLAMQGVNPEKAEIDWERLRKEQEEPARKSVHARLLLDAVAKVQEIQVEPKEIDERIREDAKRMGQSAEKLRASLEKHSAREALVAQLLREKSLDYLTTVANIQYAD
jgi:trigger factor